MSSPPPPLTTTNATVFFSDVAYYAPQPERHPTIQLHSTAAKTIRNGIIMLLLLFAVAVAVVYYWTIHFTLHNTHARDRTTQSQHTEYVDHHPCAISKPFVSECLIVCAHKQSGLFVSANAAICVCLCTRRRVMLAEEVEQVSGNFYQIEPIFCITVLVSSSDSKKQTLCLVSEQISESHTLLYSCCGLRIFRSDDEIKACHGEYISNAYICLLCVWASVHARAHCSKNQWSRHWSSNDNFLFILVALSLFVLLIPMHTHTHNNSIHPTIVGHRHTTGITIFCAINCNKLWRYAWMCGLLWFCTRATIAA